MSISVNRVYADLGKLDRVDSSAGASYRQEAQEVLANPGISLEMRKAIADRLNEANRLLGISSTGSEDSY